MTIQRLGSELAGTGGAGNARAANDEAKVRPVRSAEAPRAADRVEISPEGRRLAELAGRAEELGIRPEKLDLILKRLDEGAYHRADLVDQVARRLLSSGDL